MTSPAAPVYLIDSHCHLDAPTFDADRSEVLARARAAGVVQQVIPAIACERWPTVRALCTDHSGLFPAYGLHPLFLHRHHPQHLTQLRDWLVHARPVAIGECGLDFWVEGLDPDRQQTLFDGQLRLAREFDLPVIVHARRAVDAVIQAIRRIGGLRGVVHSFSGSPQQARQLGSLGFMIGLGGPVTYERANRLRGLAAQVPLAQLLLETDAPDQPDARHRGQRNEPARLVHVCQAIAEVRGVPAAVIAAATSDNARRLFGLPSPVTAAGQAAGTAP